MIGTPPPNHSFSQLLLISVIVGFVLSFHPNKYGDQTCLEIFVLIEVKRLSGLLVGGTKWVMW